MTPPARHAAFVAALLGAALSANAAPVINIGNVTLQPNAAGQVVSVYVTGDTGGTPVQALNFDVSTGNGGVQFGGSLAPTITSVNLKPAGGVFAGISDSQTDTGSGPQAAFYSIAYASGNGARLTLPATSTLLAQFTVSTVGFTSGTYPLRLANVLPNSGGTYNTDFGSVAANITNGTITVATPEPAGLAALAGAAVVALRRRRSA